MQALSAEQRKQQIAARFGPTANVYDRNRAIGACAERLLELAELHPGESVLDVACGTGRLTLPAAQVVGPNGRVAGIDLTSGMLAEAQRKVHEAGLDNVQLAMGDAERLDLPDQSFDVVLCGLAVMFFPDPSAAAREWHRVLRPGGRVVFSVWQQQFGSTALREFLNARLAAHGITLENLRSGRSNDPEACRALLHEAGFIEIEVLEEEHGFFHASAEEYWEQDVASTVTATQLGHLSVEEQAQLKAEHLAEVAATATPQGIWRAAAVNFAQGHKKIN